MGCESVLQTSIGSRCNGYFLMPSNFIRLYSVKILTNTANTHFEGMQMDSF